ncbi:MAG: acetyl-CoA sensor PanZ family protein [Spongiibacteraceae bacterium]|jgi:GNAT superfamily N-acetyltransferase|nr:acetyl-CoA sensor PanZ family protein [Spongiibacteraceae bacterium]
MPVYLEVINQPDAADLADLEKIYADYPLPPVASFVDWLFDQRESGRTLVGGRFNGRLLAALWLRREDNGATIEHLCVRAMTRRRGTARQLLQMLQQQAGQFQLPQLRVEQSSRAAELAPLWEGLGFSADERGWHWP